MKMNKIRSAEIICVGTELLLGQIINTNAAWLARELSLLGIYSYYQTVVGDNAERLTDMLKTATGRSDLIILTGGLGPTQDDLTMATVAAFAGRPMLLHQESQEAIAARFQLMHQRHVPSNNWKQAMMPEGALVLPNKNGTAPGAMLTIPTSDNRAVTLVMLPGPPSEMQPMFSESVRPQLVKCTTTRLKHCFVRMIGIGESAAESRLLDLISSQTNPTVAPYAAEGEVMFRVTQSLGQDEKNNDKTAAVISEIQKRLGDHIYEIGTRSLPEVVKDLLTERGLTVSFAESCTGGMISAALTDIPGASTSFTGCMVAYDKQVKIQQLHVPETVIQDHGEVSEACARAMATGCRDVFNTTYSLAVTGLAGSSGGSAEKPVGLIWLAVAGPKEVVTRQLQLTGSRSRIRRVTVLQALDFLRRQVLT
ncbi:MAG: competence/damage-inducible protein A [Clostridiaceae bacterium]|nr:competence/damage-inducible protein A [Clostridiaceae bacterium]